MTEEKEKTYIGDGVYVDFDGYQVGLYTQRENGTHYISWAERTARAERFLQRKDEIMNTDIKQEIDLTGLDDDKSMGDLVVQGNLPATGFNDSVVTAQAVKIRRRPSDVIQRMKVLAAAAGEEYRYSFPVKSKTGRTSTVEGPTIKLANDLAREYGNCMVDVRVVEQGDKWIYYARFIDLETGFCMTRPFAQRKEQKTMKTDDGRAADIVFQIGSSKAIRNVIVNALQTYADITFQAAKDSLVQTIGQDIEGWRKRISDRCAELDFDLKRIEVSVGKPVKEWIASDIAKVVAELKSVRDGMATFDDLYPVEKPDLNKEFLKGDGAQATTMPPPGQEFKTSSTAEPGPIRDRLDKLEDTVKTAQKPKDKLV